MTDSENTAKGLRSFLSPLMVIAFAVGCSVGWGSLVVTSNTYLRQAGPWGSISGLLIGAALMLLVCRNYSYIANRYPDDAGIFSYTRSVFGYDRAFIVSWFVFLLYLSMFWANATAVPLFARYIFGDLFCFGHMYTIFGYEVYLGELLLTIAVVWLTALLLLNSRVLTARAMIVLVSLILVCITVCFVVAFSNSAGSGISGPAFASGEMPPLQILRIALISPWAFIGFESVTNSSREFRFSKTRLFRILAVSVILTTALYVFVILLSVSAHPEGYGSWVAYINDLDNLSGIEALPAFYAAHHYLGDAGLVLMFISLFALVVTSLIANMWALIRLVREAGENSIVSEKYSSLNRHGVPSSAIISVAVMSSVIPFFGRSAIGWIVDVTTIVATFLYGFISAATMKCAKADRNRGAYVSGLIVLVVMALFGTELVTPGFSDSLETETYLLFILWSVCGMIFFHRVIGKDHARRFGKAILVWIVLITLVIYLGVIWMNKVQDSATSKVLLSMEEYYSGNAPGNILALSADEYMEVLNRQLDTTRYLSLLAFLALVLVSVGGVVSNYLSMKRYQTKLENEVALKTKHLLEMQDNFVLGMATMVESRDNSTGGHIRRTSDIVRILVRKMEEHGGFGKSDEYYKKVIKAAPMHDLGKIAVDDVILRKPGKYTPEEFEAMKTHAKEGARIVSEILKGSDDEDFSRIAENMAHYHHERVDGSGYPERLKGDEIPLEARIMAIADVYDALVSKRVYKEKMSFEEADRIILEGMGRQFDSSLESCYREARPEFEAYYSTVKD